MNVTKHTVSSNSGVVNVLSRLNQLGRDAVLFVLNEEGELIGSVTDGDVRRGLLNDSTLSSPLTKFINRSPKFFRRGITDLSEIREWRDSDLKIIPVLNYANQIVDIINFRQQKSFLPVDGVIMAGGIGSRLYPLTKDTPKPMLEIGGKPIIQHNIELLRSYGVKHLTISIRYLGQQIIDYFGDGSEFGLSIKYIEEKEPRGTIGALSYVKECYNPYLLLMNSDLLTNIDLEKMFIQMIADQADMVVATTPYEVAVPYGIIRTVDGLITGIDEKPTYTYHSNAGIYIFKRDCKDLIPESGKFNATDLMESLIHSDQRVAQYPIVNYWLDIGKPNDFEKAQHDVQYIY